MISTVALTSKCLNQEVPTPPSAGSDRNPLREATRSVPKNNNNDVVDEDDEDYSVDFEDSDAEGDDAESTSDSKSGADADSASEGGSSSSSEWVAVKYTFQQSLRRSNLQTPLTLEALRKQLLDSFPQHQQCFQNDRKGWLAKVQITYLDDEQDRVKVTTDEELLAALQCAKQTGRVLLLSIEECANKCAAAEAPMQTLFTAPKPNIKNNVTNSAASTVGAAAKKEQRESATRTRRERIRAQREKRRQQNQARRTAAVAKKLAYQEKQRLKMAKIAAAKRATAAAAAATTGSSSSPAAGQPNFLPGAAVLVRDVMDGIFKNGRVVRFDYREGKYLVAIDDPLHPLGTTLGTFSVHELQKPKIGRQSNPNAVLCSTAVRANASATPAESRASNARRYSPTRPFNFQASRPHVACAAAQRPALPLQPPPCRVKCRFPFLLVIASVVTFFACGFFPALTLFCGAGFVSAIRRRRNRCRAQTYWQRQASRRAHRAYMKKKVPHILAKIETSELFEILPFVQLGCLFLSYLFGLRCLASLVWTSSVLALALKFARCVTFPLNAATQNPFWRRVRNFSLGQSNPTTLYQECIQRQPTGSAGCRARMGIVFVTVAAALASCYFFLSYPTTIFWVVHYTHIGLTTADAQTVRNKTPSFVAPNNSHTNQSGVASINLNRTAPSATTNNRTAPSATVNNRTAPSATTNNRGRNRNRAKVWDGVTKDQLLSRVIVGITRAPQPRQRELSNQLYAALGAGDRQSIVYIANKLLRQGIVV